MKIKGKIILSFFIVILIFSSALGVMFTQLSGVRNNVDLMDKQSTRALNMKEILSLHRAKLITMYDYIVTGEEKYVSEYEASMKAQSELLGRLEAKMTRAEEKKLFKSITETNDLINHGFMNQIVPAVKAGNLDRAQEVNDSVILPYRGTLRDSINELIKIVEDEKQLAIQNANQKMESAVVTLLVILGISIIVSLAISLFISRRITIPLKAIQQASEQIAAGNLRGDELVVKSKDEIGQLTQSINVMTKNVKQLIQEAALITDQVTASSEELTASANEMSSSIEQVASTTEQMASGANSQAEAANEALKTMQDIDMEIKQIGDRTILMEQSSQKGGEASVHGISTVNQSLQQMDQIQAKVVETANVIQELSVKTGEITDILNVIHEITDQTNLLALNAAIEAARAGEHGRGFAVVADEVRKLAEQASASTKQIAGIIHSVQTEATEAVRSMDDVVKEVESGASIFTKNGKSFEEIAGIMEEIINHINEVVAGTKGITEKVDHGVSAMKNIAAISQEASAGTEELAASLEEQNASMQEVNGMATNLSQAAEQLNQAISKFAY